MELSGRLFIIERPWSFWQDIAGTAKASQHLVTAEALQTLETKRGILQELVTAELGEENTVEIKMTYYENWAGTSITLNLLAKPTTRDQVKALIKGAKDPQVNVKIRAGGAYHTCSKFQADDGGLIINTCDLLLSDGTRIQLDTATKKVTLSPGVTGVELMKVFLDNEVCFRSDVIIPTTTYGGMFSGSCHGTGQDEPPISEYVSSMVIIDASETERTITDATELESARVNLGLFGVIVEFTADVKSMEVVEVDTLYDKTLHDVVGSPSNLTTLLGDYWSIHVVWIPFNSLGYNPDPLVGKNAKVGSISNWEPMDDRMFITAGNIYDGSESPTEPTWWSKLSDVTFQAIQGFAGTLVNRYPNIAPILLSAAFNLMALEGNQKEYMKVPWAIHYRDGLDLGRAYDMEFYFPYDPANPENVTNAVKYVAYLAKDYANKGILEPGNRYPMTLLLEMRFIARATSLLSPAVNGAANETGVACLGLMSVKGTRDFETFFEQVGSTWMGLGGLPHWQKDWEFLPNIHSYLRDTYGEERITAFDDVRKTYDPDGLFMNNALSPLFTANNYLRAQGDFALTNEL